MTIPSTPYVRPDVRALLDFIAAQPGPKMHETSPAQARAAMRAACDMADASVGELAIRRDLTMPGPHGGTIRLRLLDRRASRPPGPVMVYFHGGGFVIGDLDTHEPVCAAIARTLDLPVVSVDYRLSPEHPWPAAPDDCEAAARWVAGAPAELGLKPTAMVLAGDSAGGTLTAVTALALRDAPAAVPVIAQWPIYPAVDLATRYASFERFGDGFNLTQDAMRWFNDHYRGDPDHWRALPMLADPTGLPPTLVVTAGLDPLLDQGRAYAARLIEAGVPTIYREAVGNIHGFMNMRRAIPSSEGDLQGCLTALRPMIAEAEANRVMTQAAA